MGRGGARHVSYTALVLLCAVSGSSAGLWDVDIDHDPAPPPDQGPSFSAHATRNRALLPYQIVGILGAYLGTILLLGTLLLTVGRKLRKQALAMNDRPIELVQPIANAFDGGKGTPSIRGWGGLRKKKSTTSSVRSGTSNYGSPGNYSVASFDQNVIQDHRQRDQDFMADFYGHIYAASATGQPTSPPAYAQNNPQRLDLDRVRAQGTDQPASPMTPRSPYRRIDPPQFYPLSPRAGYPQSPTTPNRDMGTASYGSSQNVESSTSSPNRLRKGFRNTLKERGLTISPPLRMDDNSDGARTPLSPRIYTDPGRAPDPPTVRTLDSSYPPTTPGTIYEYSESSEGEMDVIRDLPPAHPQRLDDYRREQLPTSAPAHARPGLVIPQNAANRNRESPVSSTNNPLPLRQINEQIRQQAAQQVMRTNPYDPTATTSNNAALLSPNRTGVPGLGSPGPQPQYALDQRNERAPNSAILSGGLTPLYSPAGKFVYSVTPTILSFAEQKRREKEERALMGALNEEDKVIDEKDMWGESY